MRRPKRISIRPCRMEFYLPSDFAPFRAARSHRGRRSMANALVYDRVIGDLEGQ
jgi:hypothetical protein